MQMMKKDSRVRMANDEILVPYCACYIQFLFYFFTYLLAVCVDM